MSIEKTLNDRERIENAIIPMMLFNMLNQYDNEAYREALQITKDVTNEYLNCGDKRKEISRRRRLDRLAIKIDKHFSDNKYDARKGILVLTIWAYALAEQEALKLYNEKYKELLEELDDTFTIGYQKVENFDKLHNSAIKQMEKIHKLAQVEGYF